MGDDTEARDVSVGRLDMRDKAVLRAAAYRATTAGVLPPAIGALVARELLAADEFGFAIDTAQGLAFRIAAEVRALPTPDPAEPRVTPKLGRGD